MTRRIRSAEPAKPADRPMTRYEAIEIRVRLAHCTSEAQRLRILGIPAPRRVRSYDRLNQYDIEAFRVEWKACRTAAHRRAVVARHPGIEAWPWPKQDLLDINRAIRTGRTTRQVRAARAWATRRRLRA